ncbi:hypothetical protein SAMN02910342_00239 [Butyrivibrio sp. INlla21]|nr:hypothetical protein SAMN02910342_00239 [Butyrivibrio sp. INlla21]
MKTLSARIRGSKVELEELGEEEEDVLNLSSKLRREVKAMTGFDIMEDEETYKTIDQIIIGIGKHWKELTDIQQAALAEDLAGKRNSNVLIALLQNAELVEQVYDKATHAAGSAAKEQQNYMMSIQYSLDRFTASMQELEADLVDSQLVKDIVDIGTVIVNILDEIVEHIGLLGAGASIAGIVALVKNFKELKATFESMQTIAKTASLLNSKDLVEQAAANELVIATTKTLTKAQAEEILTIAGVSAATKADILAKAGLAGANATATVSVDALTASLWANVKAMAAFLVGTPVGWAILAAAAIAGTVATFDALTSSVEESKKRVDDCTESIANITSELESLRNLEKKTPYDTRRIDYLERELSVQEKLLEIEKQRNYEDLTKKTFANFFDEDNAATRLSNDIFGRGDLGPLQLKMGFALSDLRNLSAEIDSITADLDNAKTEKELKKLNKKLEDRKNKFEELKKETKSDEYGELLNKYNSYLELEEELVQALEDRTSNGDYLTTGKARRDAEKELGDTKKRLKGIRNSLREYEILAGEFDPFNSITGIESEYAINEIKNAINSTDNLKSAQDRLMAQFPSLDALCSKYGLTVKELVEYYWEQKEAVEAVTDAETKRASTLSTAVANVNSRILPQFEELGKVYDEIFNGEKGFDLSHIGAEDLEGLRSAFEDLDEDLNIDWESKTEDVDKFLSVIGNSSSTATEVQSAFNGLATSYFNAAKASGDFSEENAKVLEQMLREMGVVNANEVVMEELNAQMEVQANTAAALAAASSDMAGETENASAKFVQEAQMSNLAKVYLADLVATETVFNNTGLNVDDKVAALSQLASAYFGTAAAAKLVEMTNNRGYEHSYSVSPEEAWRQIVGEFTKIEMPKIDFSGGGKNTKAAGGAGKEAADTYIEAFEKELKALEEQRDAGILSEKQFLDKYKALIEKYFKDVDGYGDEYAKRMGDYFQRAISYYESIFSAVGTLLNKRISAAQKGRDAAVQALNDEKDAAAEAYQDQIDHLDDLIEAKEKEIDLIDDEIKGYEDQIDAIEDQIDALEEANQKRQQAINLQKAEYQLQRSLNQKTRLVNYMPRNAVMRF